MTWAYVILLNSEVEENVKRKRFSFHSTAAKYKCLAALAENSMYSNVSDAKTITDVLV